MRSKHTDYEVWVAKARTVRIEYEVARRGINLRIQGAEHVGPCPHCGGDDRFAINTKKQVFNCRGCGARGDVIALVEFLDGCDFKTSLTKLAGEVFAARRKGFKLASAPPAKQPTERSTSYERQQHEKARWLWSRRKPISGTIAEMYLRRARGIVACPLPPTLGFLPAYGHHLPALIAAFALPEEIEPGVVATPLEVHAVHLIALQPDGMGKAHLAKPKITIGSPKGLPIVLAPPNDLLGLVIAEGIEDALSLYQTTFLGAWASASATFMPAMARSVPSYIECVTIELHPDDGQRYALELADALRVAGIEVFLREARDE